METTFQKAELKYSMKTDGEQFVITIGITNLPELYADNLDTGKMPD